MPFTEGFQWRSAGPVVVVSGERKQTTFSADNVFQLVEIVGGVFLF